MPTGAAVDRVAKELGIECFQTPTDKSCFGINLCLVSALHTPSQKVQFVSCQDAPALTSVLFSCRARWKFFVSIH